MRLCRMRLVNKHTGELSCCRLHTQFPDGRVKLRDEPADLESIIWEGLGTVAFYIRLYKSPLYVDAYVCHYGS